MPLVLKAGRNRLMVRVRTKAPGGSWLDSRIEGAPLRVKASAAIEGPPPEPLVDVKPPEQYAHLWRDLWAISELDAPGPGLA